MTTMQIEPRLRHLALLASAGSGKTYRLASRFIDLIELRNLCTINP